ncbi:MAG TPA: hypothetical protein VE553_10685, partial [Candidatus Binatia bacterium]|nr:hypothetical protein [Candidatus Binatia bacterium]
MNWRRWLTAGRLLIVFIILVVFIAPEWPAFQQEEYRLESMVGQRQFDFLSWGIGALAAKLREQAGKSHEFLPVATRQDIVLSYLDWVGRARGLQSEINNIYADAAVAEPDISSQLLQAELADARLEITHLQPLAEAVVQEQVAMALEEDDFGLMGNPFPPVAMHMTPLPEVLVVSPREEIRQIYNVPLTPGLTVPDQEQLEQRIYDELDRSALVVPIGGLGFYPAMILETSNINFLADTVAHEWTHHWLSFYPLGIRYFVDPQMRTINETVASVVGTEVGAQVVREFYPQFASPSPAEAAPPAPGAETLP